uniref:ATP synthase subunit a n=1 Tax=Diplosoma listerianum TaxID=168635 RepID=D1GL01_9ASCI|nr:ATPase subunit 6 [Diplosoma listerianum]
MFISFETSFLYIFLFFVVLFLNKNFMKMLSYINIIISNMTFFNSFFLKNIFLLLLMMNLFSMFPYSFSFSTMPGIFLMGFIMWISLYLPLLFKNFKNNMAHFLPQGSPFTMSPFMIIIELVSLLARPMALGIRLMANITAGHLLIHLFCHGMEHGGYFLFIFFLLLIMLETAVAFIQAYVFTMLLTLYTSEAN